MHTISVISFEYSKLEIGTKFGICSVRNSALHTFGPEYMYEWVSSVFGVPTLSVQHLPTNNTAFVIQLNHCT